MFTFDSDQDFGPYETLFRAFRGHNVILNGLDCTLVEAGRDSVTVQLWVDGKDDFEASGARRTFDYGDVASLTVY